MRFDFYPIFVESHGSGFTSTAALLDGTLIQNYYLSALQLASVGGPTATTSWPWLLKQSGNLLIDGLSSITATLAFSSGTPLFTLIKSSIASELFASTSKLMV